MVSFPAFDLRGPLRLIVCQMKNISSALEAVRMEELHSTEAQFRKSHPWVWSLTLFGPIAFSVLVLGVIYLVAGWEFVLKVLTSLALTLFFFGRFIILAGSDGTLKDTDGALATEHLFTLVCYLDVMTALVLAFHIGFLFRLPFIGPRASALITDGHFILDAQPWMRRATFFGLIAFVAFPLAATGSVGGSIFGRLLGMTRIATFAGIVIGALLGNTMMYYFSDLIGLYLDKDNLYLKIGGVAVISLLILVLERRYQHLKAKYAASDVVPSPEQIILAAEAAQMGSVGSASVKGHAATGAMETKEPMSPSA
jgi:hypothetical protein